MKARNRIVGLLTLMCMVMLTASVLPHHHHEGMVCLQHDNTEQSGNADGTSHPGSSTCKACCVTKFNCFRSNSDDGRSLQPCPAIDLLAFVYATITEPETSLREPAHTCYHERLHSRPFLHTLSLRAPPVQA